LPCGLAGTNANSEWRMGSVRYSLSAIMFLWRSNADSKAAGAWAIPTALPSSPKQLPSFHYGSRWASELKDLPKALSGKILRPTTESYLPNSADCDRQRDKAAKFRILHKRLRLAMPLIGLRPRRIGGLKC